MDELIRDMRSKGLVTFVSRGKAQAVFNYIKVVATTEPVETDKDWWALRMFSVRN